MKGDRRACTVCRADRNKLRSLVTAFEGLAENLSPLLDFDAQMIRQRVYDRYADAVKTAGNLVGIAVELPAGIECCQSEFDAGNSGFFVDIRRDPAAVVDDAHGIILLNGYRNIFTEAGKRFVYRVVYDFVDQVMESFVAVVPDIHPRTKPDMLDSFENLYIIGSILFKLVIFTQLLSLLYFMAE